MELAYTIMEAEISMISHLKADDLGKLVIEFNLNLNA
jgi:hypothetical protein